MISTMNTLILGLLAETPIHPGAGRSMGVVDLPVAREAATDYPVLVGSSLKGALREHAGTTSSTAERLFGKRDHAGQLLVADGRLLLLPVRCLTGAFRWVTCPHLIERYRRDRLRAGLPVGFSVPSIVAKDKSMQPALAEGDGILHLEERHFEVRGPPPEALADALAEPILHKETKNRLKRQLVVLADDAFAWFVRYGLPIQARNVLDSETKQSKNLWYEETLPSESVLYSVVAGRGEQTLVKFRGLFEESRPYLQAGGNETVGQGWFAVTMISGPRTSGDRGGQ